MRKYLPIFLIWFFTGQLLVNPLKAQTNQIDLSGEWRFDIDPLDTGIQEGWHRKKLNDKISLPGSMTTNNKGNDVDINTPWTGSIFDSSWFLAPDYARFRQPGNIKIPFWLQPVKYYKGAAWYQKTVEIPADWNNRHIELFIERSHWETTVWVDDQMIGVANSLGTPHIFDLSKHLTAGTHQITIRIDNRIKDFNVGQNAHSITDHTQGNWNGMIGKLLLSARTIVFIEDLQLYPDVHKKQVTARLTIKNSSKNNTVATIRLLVAANEPGSEKLKPLVRSVPLKKGSNSFEFIYPMGNHPLLWDEFHPNLYTISVELNSRNQSDQKTVSFGMREFVASGSRLAVNGRSIFLRGTLECAIFPLTGYPATDVDSWLEIFKMAKYYGLNHMRFHSWCPPEAAFEAADRSGFYLQVEASTWVNQGAVLGDGMPIDQYLYKETERILQAYGNHPSFCMMASGNEPAGKHHAAFLAQYVHHWKEKDPRRLYTTASGWPVMEENNYNSSPAPRIQGWGQGVHSILNGQAPRTDYDWADMISKWEQPTVSHEIGQWCVYPDFKEIRQYTGVLKPKNFEIFQQTLEDRGLGHLADSFLLASGKLQTLCYKADIEAALRTKGFAGFQLLDLHDFPGQGTALVGVLNPFWKEKGYVTGKEFSRFCNTTVPLARFSKMIFQPDENLSIPLEAAHFGEKPLENITPEWIITNPSGDVVFKGSLPKTTIPVGSNFSLGQITQPLSNISKASQLTLTVSLGNFQNSWDFFVYPSYNPPADNNVLITRELDEKAIAVLNNGGKVLLTFKKGSIRTDKGGAIAVGFSSIFWNTAWTKGQPPHTLGILCNPEHPALKAFPTDYYSNWQWWDAMSHANAIMLDSVAKGLQPIVRIVDDWNTNRSLGLIFEAKVANGKLLVASVDLLDQQESRPEARQLLLSLAHYMNSADFNPSAVVDPEKIKSLISLH